MWVSSSRDAVGRMASAFWPQCSSQVGLRWGRRPCPVGALLSSQSCHPLVSRVGQQSGPVVCRSGLVGGGGAVCARGVAVAPSLCGWWSVASLAVERPGYLPWRSLECVGLVGMAGVGVLLVGSAVEAGA